GGDNNDKDEDDDDENNNNDENDEKIRNKKEKKGGSENVEDDNVKEGITYVEQKDENVEEEKEKKKVKDDMVWDKTKAIVPFEDYHDYEINDTQSSTKNAEYNDNVSGVTHVIDEANVAGASSALESKKIRDPSLVFHQMIEDMTKLPLISDALKEAAHDVPLSSHKKEVRKKIKVKVVVKTSAKAVEVPDDKVVDTAKKKVAAMKQFKQPRPATKIIKVDYQTPKRGRKRVVISGKRMRRKLLITYGVTIVQKEEKETSNRYYLICFNMMTAEIDIIDNIHKDLEDLDLRYGPYAMAL
nr:ulp1 protease family, C-terminal catalytic domain-containing protein [Tanacetum cinerariifolium]